MQDDPAKKIALDLMARATVIEMRERAEELAELCIEREIPRLPADARARELDLMELLVRERDRSRRILALVAM